MKYLLILILVCMSVRVSSEIYKWTDDKGRVHFSDSKNRPRDATIEKMDLKINTYTNTTFETTDINTDRVIMYSAAWCGFCKKARKYFIANRIPYVEYDVDRDQSAKRRYKKLGAKGVPVILYKDRRMNGFSIQGFERIYRNGV